MLDTDVIRHYPVKALRANPIWHPGNDFLADHFDALLKEVEELRADEAKFVEADKINRKHIERLRAEVEELRAGWENCDVNYWGSTDLWNKRGEDIERAEAAVTTLRAALDRIAEEPRHAWVDATSWRLSRVLASENARAALASTEEVGK